MRTTTITRRDCVDFFTFLNYRTMTILKKTLWSLGALALTLSSCEEIPPTITPCQTDRVVLVEEFTGIDCVNCPTGAEKLKSITQQNPGKVIVVGIHAGYFAVDHNGFYLNAVDGESLEANYLGPVTGYPAATVNRKVFANESDHVTTLGKWAGHISQELCERAIMDIDIVPAYNKSTRELSVVVNVAPKDFVNDVADNDLALTIMITEDDIVGYQKTPTGIDMDYVHKHVLRDVLSTNYSGDVLFTKGMALEAKQQTVQDYALPANWEADNCHIIAFIHRKSGNDKSVLQAAEKSLK